MECETDWKKEAFKALVLFVFGWGSLWILANAEIAQAIQADPNIMQEACSYQGRLWRSPSLEKVQPGGANITLYLPPAMSGVISQQKKALEAATGKTWSFTDVMMPELMRYYDANSQVSITEWCRYNLGCVIPIQNEIVSASK